MELSEHITQIAGALALIVALVVGLGWLVKKLNHGGFSGNGDIRIVASTFLGPKEKVLLLEVKDRQVLIGVNAGGITALSEFAADTAVSAPGAFAGVLAEAKK
jgi:flagellar protein FliO/FliZ